MFSSNSKDVAENRLSMPSPASKRGHPSLNAGAYDSEIKVYKKEESG